MCFVWQGRVSQFQVLPFGLSLGWPGSLCFMSGWGPCKSTCIWMTCWSWQIHTTRVIATSSSFNSWQVVHWGGGGGGGGGERLSKPCQPRDCGMSTRGFNRSTFWRGGSGTILTGVLASPEGQVSQTIYRQHDSCLVCQQTRQGEVQTPFSQSEHLWCQDYGINVTACHITGRLNILTDTELLSRNPAHRVDSGFSCPAASVAELIPSSGGPVCRTLQS